LHGNDHNKIFICYPRIITRGIEKMYCAELKIVSHVSENSMIDLLARYRMWIRAGRGDRSGNYEID